MNGIYYYLIAFIIIWLIAIVFKNQLSKYGVEMNFPLLMWKTKKLRGFIDRLANKSPKFWRWYMNIGLVVSVVFMVIMAISLVYSLTQIMTTPSVSLIVPGVEVPGSSIYVPLLSGIIALATVLLVHEFSHGIIARVEGIKVKSIGLLLLAVLPGAFVEPDDEELNDLNLMGKLRIYTAGSVANLSLAVIALIIMLILSSFIIPAVFNEEGVVVEKLTNDGPAINHLSRGMVIKEIDNKTINGSEDYKKIVSTLKPNNRIEMVTDHGTYSFKLANNPNNKSLGYMGIQPKSNQVVSDKFNNHIYTPILWFLLPLKELIFWIFFLNFAVGTFNLLPMKPLDGGHIFEGLLSYISSKEIYKPIATFMSFFMGIIIIVSLAYSFIGAF